MAYLVDTNIVIHARDGTQAVLDKFAEHDGAIVMSALSLAELQRGFSKSDSFSALRRERLRILLPRIPVIAFDAAAAETYGLIIAQSGWVKGRDYDRMIAAHAIVTGSTLVTDNESDFSNIAGLSLENWARS